MVFLGVKTGQCPPLWQYSRLEHFRQRAVKLPLCKNCCQWGEEEVLKGDSPIGDTLHQDVCHVSCQINGVRELGLKECLLFSVLIQVADG